MRATRHSATLFAALGAAVLMAPMHAAAQTEKVLYSFSSKNGYQPEAGVTLSPAGNLYGTTVGGGAYGWGTAFELAPTVGGEWQEEVLYNFEGSSDASSPLVSDDAGSLYGTTELGGTHNFGTVFELSRGSDGNWTEQVLYNFRTGDTGQCPFGGLVLDSAGHLYGTTQDYVCSGRDGEVFELARGLGGRWAGRVLYRFTGNGNGGKYPGDGLVSDSVGNLYGTTDGGGGSRNCTSFGCGTVFELMPSTGGWTEKTLYSFNGKDGEGPLAPLVFDASGNLYGTTSSGGDSCCGTVFELSPTADGSWTEKVLYSFSKNGDGAYYPNSVVIDAAGNLYGTTGLGGAYNAGTIFELSPTPGEGWVEKILYSFNSNGIGGDYPESGLTIDPAGNLYGTTVSGGAYGAGTVFEITP